MMSERATKQSSRGRWGAEFMTSFGVSAGRANVARAQALRAFVVHSLRAVSQKATQHFAAAMREMFGLPKGRDCECR